MSADSLTTEHVQAVPFYILPEFEGHVVFHSKLSTLRLRASAAGQIVELVLPLLDGSRSRAEVIAQLSTSIAPERAAALLAQLEKHSFLKITEAAPATVAPDMIPRLESMRRYLASDDDSGWDAVAELRAAHVAIVNLGAMSGALLLNLVHAGVGSITLLGGDTVSELDISRVQFLRGTDVGRPWGEVVAEAVPFGKFNTRFHHVAEIPVRPDEWEAALGGVTMVAAVVDGPTYFQRSIAGLNQTALKSKTPWIMVGNVQHVGLAVGPTFVPGATPCLVCFEARLKSNMQNLQIVELLEKFSGDGGKHVEFGEIAPGVDIAANLACLEIIDTLVSGRLAKTSGKLLTLDLESHAFSLHNVLRLPRCPACRPMAKSVTTRIWA